MSFQTLIALAAVSLSVFYFVRGAFNDLRQERAGTCGKCASGGCPVAPKG